ncbi:MAG TPA: NUDIX hydrolase [Ktedonobacterales bacterium]
MSENGPEELVFQGRIITVRLKSVRYPDGGVSQYVIVDHPDAVGIVALRDGEESRETGVAQEPQVALVRQMCPAIDRTSWEMPVGLVAEEEQQHPEDAAARELAEETGYRADHLRFLARHHPAPGVLNGAILIYLATGLSLAPDHPIPDPNEIEQLVWKPLSQALDWCRQGIIDDGKTGISLWCAWDAMDRHKAWLMEQSPKSSEVNVSRASEESDDKDDDEEREGRSRLCITSQAITSVSRA